MKPLWPSGKFAANATSCPRRTSVRARYANADSDPPKGAWTGVVVVNLSADKFTNRIFTV